MTDDSKFDREYELTSNSPNDSRTLKSWGYVTALPSEYLLHFRNGKIQEKNSGQGTTCFKYPSDTVFIIPTSLKEIIFQTNQLTKDNVDIRLKGMAVYRISDPLQIYRLINFSDRSRAEQKLAGMLADICKSTVKWLVANLNLEDCIRKRKEEISEALKKELSYIVASDQGGWGIEIITINIQDIFIQDEEIFSAMQMMFKTEKLRESHFAELQMQKELEIKNIQNEQLLSEHRKKSELERQKISAEIRENEIELSRATEKKRFELERYQAEQQEELNQFRLEKELERERQTMLLNLERAEKETETRKIYHKEELEHLKNRLAAENTATPVNMEMEFNQNVLPKIADILASSMGEVKYNIFSGNEKNMNPMAMILSDISDIFKSRLRNNDSE